MTAVAERAKRTRGKKAPAPPAIDPVTAYAAGVRSGAIVAGRAVRLAADRHFRDLEHQCTPEFPYYFDQAAARHIIDFFPTFLTLENGDPFHLPDWLKFSYGSIFGWKVWGGEARDVFDPARGARAVAAVELPPDIARRAGLRRIQHGFFETSKGSGKTPSGGGIGLYGLAFDDEPYAEIYSTGFDTEQASIILNDAIRMGQASPDLLEILLIDKYNIAHPGSGSFMRAMSSQHRSKSGPRPQYVLSDEIHEHRDGTVVTKAEAGFKNRRQPLGLKYTNSGSDRASYCWQLHQKSIEVLESAVIHGQCIDDQWFAYVCHLDPCERCFEEGYRQPKDGCAECDNWMAPEVWPKIAPALGVVIQPKYLQDAITAALTIPSDYNLKRRLNFCIWTETHQMWISADRWDACRKPTVSTSNEALHPCAAGLDPSSVLDLTSFVVALRYDEAPDGSASTPETVEIEGLDEAGQRVVLAYELNFHVELVPFFWLPEQTLLERVRKEAIPYDVWSRKDEKRPWPHQHLFVTPGPAIDQQAIYDFIIKDAWKRFHIQRLGMDENSGRLLFLKLKNEGKLGDDKLGAVGQGKKLSEAFKFMEILVAHRRLWHDGHPVLAWNMANAEPNRDRIGALWIEKPSETKRIDGVIAAAMAIKELMALPATRKKKVRVFFMGGANANAQKS